VKVEVLSCNHNLLVRNKTFGQTCSGNSLIELWILFMSWSCKFEQTAVPPDLSILYGSLLRWRREGAWITCHSWSWCHSEVNIWTACQPIMSFMYTQIQYIASFKTYPQADHSVIHTSPKSIYTLCFSYIPQVSLSPCDVTFPFTVSLRGQDGTSDLVRYVTTWLHGDLPASFSDSS